LISTYTFADTLSFKEEETNVMPATQHFEPKDIVPVMRKIFDNAGLEAQEILVPWVLKNLTPPEQEQYIYSLSLLFVEETEKWLKLLKGTSSPLCASI
jgi:hypothetical protein